MSSGSEADPLAPHVIRRDHDGVELRVPVGRHDLRVLVIVVATYLGLSAIPAVAMLGGGQDGRTWLGLGLAAVGLLTMGVAGALTFGRARELRIELTTRSLVVERRTGALTVPLARIARARRHGSALCVEEHDGRAHHFALPGFGAAAIDALAGVVQQRVDEAHGEPGSPADVPLTLTRLRAPERE